MRGQSGKDGFKRRRPWAARGGMDSETIDYTGSGPASGQSAGKAARLSCRPGWATRDADSP
ncbi:hypothetical protein C7S15_1923 [Burkholderia cepacia]|nr:hypothetical protein [Burkholderia cepacia]